jgi:hypothetical protein
MMGGCAQGGEPAQPWGGTACCLLPAACCLLPAASCLLPAARCPLQQLLTFATPLRFFTSRSFWAFLFCHDFFLLLKPPFTEPAGG